MMLSYIRDNVLLQSCMQLQLFRPSATGAGGAELGYGLFFLLSIESFLDNGVWICVDGSLKIFK